jgi:hypothetical protein
MHKLSLAVTVTVTVAVAVAACPLANAATISVLGQVQVYDVTASSRVTYIPSSTIIFEGPDDFIFQIKSLYETIWVSYNGPSIPLYHFQGSLLGFISETAVFQLLPSTSPPTFLPTVPEPSLVLALLAVGLGGLATLAKK